MARDGGRRVRRCHGQSSGRANPAAAIIGLVKAAVVVLGFCLLGPGSRGAAPLARFEPPDGCYLGAFIEHDAAVLGDIARFESIVGRRHASYLTYTGYGRPFPAEFVAKCGRRGAAAHLGWEPNLGLAMVQDDAYLRGWARDAAASGVPIFVRFASEMNGTWMPYSGNPTEYVRAWRTVARVLREEAPNVALVWCVYATPTRTIPLYYPGDEWVDWVGVNLYSVVYHNNDPTQPAADKDPREQIRYVYDSYAARKPIMVAEYAATTWCKVVGGPTVGFAIDKMKLLYSSLRVEFPRIKCIQWFSWDTIEQGAAHNNYSVTADPVVTATYHALIRDSWFRDRVVTGSRPAVRISEFELLGSPTVPGMTAPLLGREVSYRDSAPAAAAAPTELDLSDLDAARAVQRSPVGLREIQPGQVISGPIELEVYHPAELRVRMVIFRLDDGSLHATNRSPFRYLWNPRALTPGRYQLSVRLITERGETIDSPPLSVEVRRPL